MRLKNIQIIWKMQKVSKNKIFLPCHSSVRWSNPGDFLKAQFVIFRCQKYVKKGYIEMRKWIYFVPLKSVLGRSILHYWPCWLFQLTTSNCNFFCYFYNDLSIFNHRISRVTTVLKTALLSRSKCSWNIFFEWYISKPVKLSNRFQ